MSESDINMFLDHWNIIRKDGTPVLNGKPVVFEAALKELFRANTRENERLRHQSTLLWHWKEVSDE